MREGSSQIGDLFNSMRQFIKSLPSARLGALSAMLQASGLRQVFRSQHEL